MYTVYTFNICTLVGHVTTHGWLIKVAKTTSLEKQKQKIPAKKEKVLNNRSIFEIIPKKK